jgi:hypothetical protein
MFAVHRIEHRKFKSAGIVCLSLLAFDIEAFKLFYL